MREITFRMLLVLIAFAWTSFHASANGAEKATRLRIAYVSPTGAMAPAWMAAASSAFQSQGLEVELVYIQANAGIAALVAGEIDAVQISAPPIVPVVLAGGDVTMIAGLLNHMI